MNERARISKHRACRFSCALSVHSRHGGEREDDKVKLCAQKQVEQAMEGWLNEFEPGFRDHRQRQAAEVFRQGQQQLRKAQAGPPSLDFGGIEIQSFGGLRG